MSFKRGGTIHLRKGGRGGEGTNQGLLNIWAMWNDHNNHSIERTRKILIKKINKCWEELLGQVGGLGGGLIPAQGGSFHAIMTYGILALGRCR